MRRQRRTSVLNSHMNEAIPPLTYLPGEGLDPLKRATFSDIREALGAIVMSYNAVEQYFCEAIAYSIREDADSSMRIVQARRNMGVLQKELSKALRVRVQELGRSVEFDALMKRFDELQNARNDCIHSQWILVEDRNHKPTIRIRIAKDGQKTLLDFDASELRKLANDIQDFGEDLWKFFLNISPAAEAAHEARVNELLNNMMERDRQKGLLANE
jgi:hypothetical protein